MAYWPLGLWFFGAALSIGWIMGPATDAVMGAVPEEKSGVASAMNDVTRQVAGALGVAVIGSLVSSLYASRVEDASSGLPAEQAAAAEDSIGAAVAIADRCPTAPERHSARRGERLHRGARRSASSSLRSSQPPERWSSPASCRPTTCRPRRAGSRRRRRSQASRRELPS